MSDQRGEGTGQKRRNAILRQVAAGIGVSLAMLVSGAVAFFSVYRQPPTPSTAETAPAVPLPPATQPMPRTAGDVPVNPPTAYHAMLVDAAGKPLPNIPYRVFNLHPLTPDLKSEAEGRTGSDGSLVVGPYRREGDDPDRMVLFDVPGSPWAWWNVGTGSPFLLHNQTRIVMQPALPVAGTVTDTQGKPIVDALVEAEAQTINDNTYGDCNFSEQTGQSVRTDAHGAFRFDRVPENTLLQLHVRHPDYAEYSTNAVTIGHYYPIPAGMTDVAIQLQPGATVRAQLVLGNKPLAKAGVWIKAIERAHVQNGHWVQSDDQGKLEFRSLGEGRWDFIAPNFSSPDGTLAIRRTGIVLKSGESRNLNIVCDAGTLVTGVVKDPVSHQPVHETTYVEVATPIPWGVYTESDKQGKFSFRLPTAHFRMHVPSWDNGRYRDVNKDVDVKPGMPPVEIEATPRPIVRGQLTDSNGKPIAGRVVIGDVSIATQSDGRFAIPAPQTNWNGVVGIATDYDQTVGTGFSFSATDAAQPLELFLEPMTSFTGQFIDDKNQPVNADVRTQFIIRLPRGSASPESTLWTTTIDKDGKFNIGPVPAGFRMEMLTFHNGEQRYRRMPYYEGGHPNDLGHVRVCADNSGASSALSDAAITGTIVDEENNPVIAIQVNANLGSVPTTVTDIKGRFTMTHLPRDRDIALSASSDNYGTCDWTAHAGKADLHLTMTPLGTDLIGKPAPDLIIAKWINPSSDKIADYRGKVVLLQTGTWIQSFPPGQSDVTRAYDKYKDKGFVLLTINQAWGINRVQDVENWVKQNKVMWPCAIDATDDHTPPSVSEHHGEGATASIYASHHEANMSYLIDKKGIIRACPAGKDRDLDAWISKLLAE